MLVLSISKHNMLRPKTTTSSIPRRFERSSRTIRAKTPSLPSNSCLCLVPHRHRRAQCPRECVRARHGLGAACPLMPEPPYPPSSEHTPHLSQEHEGGAPPWQLPSAGSNSHANKFLPQWGPPRTRTPAPEAATASGGPRPSARPEGQGDQKAAELAALTPSLMSAPLPLPKPTPPLLFA